MSDRYSGLLVVLEKDMREDDAKPLIEAILMLKGVLQVTPHFQNIDEYIAEGRIKIEFAQKVMNVFYPIKEAS